MICREGKVSVVSFTLSLSIQLFGVSEYGEKLALLLSDSIFTSFYSLFLLYFIVLVLALSIGFKSKDFQVSVEAGAAVQSMTLFFFLDRHQSRHIGLLLRHKSFHHIHPRRSIQIVRHLRSLSYNVSLLGIPRHFNIQSSIAYARLIHAHAQRPVWHRSGAQLDRVLH